ncbi:MAG: hypothetical protein VR74_05445 [Hyphomonas sp. BRH_c22]|uniref:hypothetical protein n=1 Tax=Hyphomonas sp. BRH_c22 TaxID=1629710 RepID=UPI0005F26F3E|nr:hypothetical protein [Hyphomonas sp. BRH_c22]KJS38525.1 MAG: hypothetical protein VR74_05445 [Hyphomonas sp. BRH_c22]
MLFKMILDGSGEEERPIVRGLLKHLIIGFGCGLLVGAVGLFLVLQALGNMRLDMPIIFVAAMMLQFGPVGGLVGVGIYLSRITDRSRGDEDDNDEGPGGRKVHVETPAAPRAAPVTLRPARA